MTLLDETRSATDVAICPSCGDHNPSAARFCMGCGVRMTVEEGERRIVTVMFVDLEGFLSFAASASPEEVQHLADTVTSMLIEVLTGFGGTLDKIIGENGLKVMGIFGAPVAHEDDPERAVRAALAMHDRAEQRSDRFAGCRLSIGIHTGEAIYAPIGPSGDHTVLGDTVNTAARLMGAASAGETLIGQLTARDVAHAIELDEITPLTVKNKRQPVPAWRARGVRGEQRTHRVARTRLIGRDEELGSLRTALEGVEGARAPHLRLVIGAAGVGKSRLLSTFTSEVARQARTVTGHCLSFGEGITYWPIVEIIKELAGIAHGDPPEEVSTKLGDVLESLGIDDLDQLRTIAVAVANVVAAPTTPRGTYSAEKISKRELHWGLRRLLSQLSMARPLIILIEDLHWAEPTMIELLSFLMEDPDPSRLLIVGTTRPETQEAALSLARGDRRSLIELGPLDEDASRSLLAELTGDIGGSSLALLDAAAGNPLFLEEIVQMLVDTGRLDTSGADRGDPVPVPDSLHALIDARLDRLGARERRIAGRAAVVGHVFWVGAVQHLDPDTDVEHALATLESKEIVVRLSGSSIAGETEYIFKHVMLRDVAYERIPKVERAILHERCGGWIEALPGSEDGYVEFIAYHLEQSARLAEAVGTTAHEAPTLAAVQALLRAGRKAQNHEGTTEADRFYERGLSLVGERYPETALELRARRAATTTLLGEQRDAVEAWTDVAQEAPTVGRSDLRGEALVMLANMLGRRGEVDRADGLLDEALGIFRHLDDRASEVRVMMLSGNLTLNRRGDLAGLTRLEEALDVAEDLGQPEAIALCLAQLGTSYLNLGRPTDAQEPFGRCAEVATGLASVHWRSVALSSLAFVHFLLGPWAEAEAAAREALVLLARNPQFTAEFQTHRLLGRMSLLRGDLVEADRRLRLSRDIVRRSSSWWIVGAERHVAEVAWQQGDADEVVACAGSAREHATSDAPSIKAQLAVTEAYEGIARGDAATLRTRFESGIELLDGRAFAFDRAEETLAYARALRTIGDDPRADRWLDRAAEEYAAMDAAAVLTWIDGARRTT